jgi:hypothetical protein
MGSLIIKSFGFPNPDSGETVTVLVIYDTKSMTLIRLSNDSIYDPVFRTINDENIFVNQKYIMIVNYQTKSIEYINLIYGYSILRNIWPKFDILPLLNEKKIYIIHDFFLAKLASDPTQILTIKIAQTSPYISKQNQITVNINFIKFLRTDDISIVIFNSDQKNFQALLNTNILKYKLSPKRSNYILKNQKNRTVLFSFFTKFLTYNDHVFLNEISVNIPKEYFINSLEFSEIQITSTKKLIDFSYLFSGNIYSIDFKNEEITNEKRWMIENTCNHQFKITIPNEDILITYTPYLYITPMEIVNLEIIDDNFIWGEQAHSEEYLFVQNLNNNKIAFFKQINDIKIKLLSMIDVTTIIKTQIENISFSKSKMHILSDYQLYIYDIQILYQLIEYKSLSFDKPEDIISLSNQSVLLKEEFFLSGTQMLY